MKGIAETNKGGMSFYVFTHDCVLQSIIIPNSVTSIGTNIFQNCYRLTEIHCKNPTPPEIGEFCFDDFINIIECKLYVPKDSKEAYQKAWDFEKIIEE